MNNGVTLGTFSFGFLSSPAKLSTLEFFGVAFVIVAIAVHWSYFVNDIA